MRNRLCLAAMFAVVCISTRANAQAPQPLEPNRAENADTIVSRAPNASSIDRPSDAVRRTSEAAPTPLPATTQSMGQAKALMAVGGAAIVVGALVDGDGGQILMIGGAVVGLYGLWLYLK